MIRVNLLPPEHRPTAGTPIARFAALVVGVALVVGSGFFWTYTHFVQLARVTDLRTLRESEAVAKDHLKDRSLALQREIDEYQQRRVAIQTINRNRVLWSRKLDQFFDIVAARDAPYTAWLTDLDVPPQQSTAPRRGVAGAAPADGGTFRFTGMLAMQMPNEAPAQNSAFYKTITGDPEATGRASEFFVDFQSISNPTIDIQERGEKNLTPPVAGQFKYELRLRAPVVDAVPKPGAAAARK